MSEVEGPAVHQPHPGDLRQRTADAVAAGLAHSGIAADQRDAWTWELSLSGEQRRGMPVRIHVDERTTLLQAFFMRAPDEHHAELYATLLRRHQRSYLLRFALSDDGDVLLLAVVPHAAMTGEELDRLLGQLVRTADESHATALRLGFASYIDREQAWRARVGAPRNPIT